MKRSDRPGLFAHDKSRAYRQRLEAIAKLMVLYDLTEQEARARLREEVRHYRDMEWPYEPCHAKTRRGTKCIVRALANGRCRFHGGLSTGPKTPEGKLRALKNLRQNR